jgi:hypothetical protein
MSLYLERMTEEMERQWDQTSLFRHEMQLIRGVLRWLHDRTELDNAWLIIIDNADDLS